MGMQFQGFGVALATEANEIMRVDGVYGPISIAVENLGTVEVVLEVQKKADLSTHNSALSLDTDSEASAEATGYTGDTATLDFTGQTLNQPAAGNPATPGTVRVTPTAGGDTVNATDKYGDGRLITDDVDEDECGTVCYFGGTLTLHYPTGKAPNTGAITCSYQYGAFTQAKGIRTYRLTHVSPDDVLVIKAAANSAVAQVKIEVFAPAPQ